MVMFVQPLLVELVNDVCNEIHAHDLALMPLVPSLLDPLLLSSSLLPSVLHPVANCLDSAQSMHELHHQGFDFFLLKNVDEPSDNHGLLDGLSEPLPSEEPPCVHLNQQDLINVPEVDS